MKYTLSKPVEVDLSKVEDFDCVAVEDFIHKTANFIGIAFGNRIAYIEWAKEHREDFENLNPDKLVRTVMPKDLELVNDALNDINSCLSKLRGSEPIDLEKDLPRSFAAVGITYINGHFGTANFHSGNWGEGKGKSGLTSPMTFSKTIEEFGWHNKAGHMLDEFVHHVVSLSESKVKDSVNRHFKDISRAMGSQQEKDEVDQTKKKIIIQIKQFIGIRDPLIKFFFSQLKKIASACTDRKKDEKEKNNGF